VPSIREPTRINACRFAVDLVACKPRGIERGLTQMLTRRVLVSAAALALLSAPALAQATQPGMQPAKPAPTAAAPAKPATTGAASATVAAKTNLNTATEAQLDKLPKLGPARSKAIIEARNKARFKDWDDFVARKVVPTDVAAAIKDSVSF
jgi:DNA uptake protein ComE-like DNA-binding protein